MERTDYIQVRVSPVEKAAWQAAAEMIDMSLSELIRLAMIRFIASMDPRSEAERQASSAWRDEQETIADLRGGM